jgi:hypothetical protein
MINSDGAKGSKELSDYILQLYTGKKLPLTANILSQPFKLCLAKINSTGNLLSDYNLAIHSSKQINQENIY